MSVNLRTSLPPILEIQNLHPKTSVFGFDKLRNDATYERVA